MSDYVKATNFTAKDSLPSGNSGKIVKGSEIDTEFNAIASAISSKTDSNSPTLTGTPVAPTASAGTNTTQIATTAFVSTAITNERTATTTLTNKTLTSPTINGGAITGITDLAVADGGTGVSTIAANAVVLGNGTSAIQTVAPSTNGNVLTSNGTTWVSQAPASSVTSVNGQTGAITTTNIDSIGTTIVAVHAVTAIGNSGFTASIDQNATVAGSALRYLYNYTPANWGPAPPTNQSIAGGLTNIGYNQGGTAPAGTWRCVGRSAVWDNPYNSDQNQSEARWYPGLFVRIS